jgi:flagellar motor switch protein FliM
MSDLPKRPEQAGMRDEEHDGGRHEKSIEPCNFRSAGQLSNESARVLTSMYEILARNVMNTLDVYLGVALEVRLFSIRQLSMDEYKARVALSNYVLPCSLAPSVSSMLLEIEGPLLFTMIDLLLGGGGAQLEHEREITEIDEEVMQGIAGLLAQQAERVFEPIGIVVKPGSCMKPTLAHKLFPPMEKVLFVQFEMGLAGVTGALSLVFPASLGSHQVRHAKTDPTTSPGVVRLFPKLSLEQRMLECRFRVGGTLPEVLVPVRSLAALRVGEVFLLPASIQAAGRFTLEEREIFEALPVRSGRLKAVELLAAVPDKLQQEEVGAP